jgi:hypothetical protein
MEGNIALLAAGLYLHTIDSQYLQCKYVLLCSLVCIDMYLLYVLWMHLR